MYPHVCIIIRNESSCMYPHVCILGNESSRMYPRERILTYVSSGTHPHVCILGNESSRMYPRERILTYVSSGTNHFLRRILDFSIPATNAYSSILIFEIMKRYTPAPIIAAAIRVTTCLTLSTMLNSPIIKEFGNSAL